MIYRIILWVLTPLFRRRTASVEGVEHLPSTGGFLIAANHIDYLDGFFLAIMIGRKRPILVKFLSETSNYRWIGGATIPIDKSEKADALDLAFSALHKGSAICFFVEGRRNSSSVLLPGKTGLLRLALKSGFPVIPIGIVGPSGKNFTASLFTLLFHNKPATLSIGSPLVFPKTDLATVTKDDLVAATTQVMERLAPLCHKTTH